MKPWKLANGSTITFTGAGDESFEGVGCLLGLSKELQEPWRCIGRIQTAAGLAQSCGKSSWRTCLACYKASAVLGGVV